MLTARDARRDTGRRRAVPSQKQRYHEYVLQQIEGYKNSISREELLRVADEATASLHDDAQEQLVLTEMLMVDVVDAFIMKRLRIKKFDRWKASFAKLRAAQRVPTHWGLDRTNPVVGLLGRIEPGDRVLCIGPGTEPAAYLLAAYDAEIRFWDANLRLVERVERKIRIEDLGMRFLARWIPLDVCIPDDDDPYDVLVLDVGALADFDPHLQATIITRLQGLTIDGGVHVLLPSRTLVPEAVYSFYGGWEREAPVGLRRSAKSRGVALVKPLETEFLQAEGA